MVRKIIKSQDKTSKRIRVPKEERGSSNSEYPSFSFRWYQRGSDVCEGFRKNTAIGSGVIDFLARVSQSTWSEIQTQNHKGYGTEIIEQQAIKAPLPCCVTPEIKIHVFRVGKKCRLAGFRQQSTFNVLWIDTSPFKLYDHG